MRRTALYLAACLSASGCSWLNGLPWVGDDREPPPLPAIAASSAFWPLWQAGVGNAATGVFSPAVSGGRVAAADGEGGLALFDAERGNRRWQVDTDMPLTAGVGMGEGLIVVATGKGGVLAYGPDGRRRWRARVSSEVLSAPAVGGGTVVVRSQDGKVAGLDAADGKRRWLYERATPALSLRTPAGALIDGDRVFAGLAGGKLVALALADGAVVWEATVSQPRGTNEIERISDVAGAPVADAERVCAVAYQGRVACFERGSGKLLWAADASSAAGLAMDEARVYVTAENGEIVAFDKGTGVPAWRQAKLAGRSLSVPLPVGEQLVLGDGEGYLHALARTDGRLTARTDTGGEAVVAPPQTLPNGVLVQTLEGGLRAYALR